MPWTPSFLAVRREDLIAVMPPWVPPCWCTGALPEVVTEPSSSCLLMDDRRRREPATETPLGPDLAQQKMYGAGASATEVQHKSHSGLPLWCSSCVTVAASEGLPRAVCC